MVAGGSAQFITQNSAGQVDELAFNGQHVTQVTRVGSAGMTLVQAGALADQFFVFSSTHNQQALSGTAVNGTRAVALGDHTFLFDSRDTAGAGDAIEFGSNNDKVPSLLQEASAQQEANFTLPALEDLAFKPDGAHGLGFEDVHWTVLSDHFLIR